MTYVSWWTMKPGPERQAAKAASEKPDYRRVKIHPAGIIEFASHLDRAYRGETRTMWPFGDDETSRRFAWAMALSSWRFISSSIEPRESPQWWLQLHDRRTGRTVEIRTPTRTNVSNALEDLLRAQPQEEKP